MLFWKDHSVNFGNGNVSGNQLMMSVEKLFLGPSVSLKFKDLGRNNARNKITLAYEWGINDKPWRTTYFELEDIINEKRTAQLIVDMTICL